MDKQERVLMWVAIAMAIVGSFLFHVGHLTNTFDNALRVYKLEHRINRLECTAEVK